MRTGDDSIFNEIDYRIRDHLGMDTKILLVLYKTCDRLRDLSDADFDRRAIFNKRRDILPDLFYYLVYLRFLEFLKRCIDRHKVIDIMNMNRAVAVGPGHLRIHLCDYKRRILRRAFYDVDRNPEAAHAP